MVSKQPLVWLTGCLSMCKGWVLPVFALFQRRYFGHRFENSFGVHHSSKHWLVWWLSSRVYQSLVASFLSNYGQTLHTAAASSAVDGLGKTWPRKAKELLHSSGLPRPNKCEKNFQDKLRETLFSNMARWPLLLFSLLNNCWNFQSVVPTLRLVYWGIRTGDEMGKETD